MARINILVNKEKLANKARRMVDMYIEENDSFLLRLPTFIYALWSEDKDLIGKAVGLIDQALDEYWEKGEVVYTYETMYSKVVSFALISHYFSTDRSEYIEKLKSVGVRGKMNTLIQEILCSNEESRKPMTGHVNSVSKLYSKIKKWNLKYNFDLLSCHDHHLWLHELSNFLIPITYRLLINSEKQNKEVFLDILNLRQTKDNELLVILREENVEKNIADVVLLDANSLIFVKWLGFDAKSPIDLSFIETIDESIEVLKKKISADQFSIVEDKIDKKQLNFLILYDSSVIKLTNEKILEFNEQVAGNIEFSDFTKF